MAATSHPFNSPPTASSRTLPNHVIVKRERGDAVHGVKAAPTPCASALDLDDRVIISDVRETVISVNNIGEDDLGLGGCHHLHEEDCVFFFGSNKPSLTNSKLINL